MNKGERDTVIAFSFILMVVGLFIGFAMPYDITSEYTWYNPIAGRYETVTSSVTVYGHPIGFVLDGIGFFMLVIGLMTKPNGSTLPTQKPFEGKICGNCYWFGKKECKRKEGTFDDMACEEYTP